MIFAIQFLNGGKNDIRRRYAALTNSINDFVDHRYFRMWAYVAVPINQRFYKRRKRLEKVGIKISLNVLGGEGIKNVKAPKEFNQ